MNHNSPQKGIQDDSDFLGNALVKRRKHMANKRPAQAIEADDSERIVGPGLIKQLCQTGPVERLARDHVLEHANSAVL